MKLIENARLHKIYFKKNDFFLFNPILLQIPVSRKRSTTDRLNVAQWPSVLPLADKTVHCVCFKDDSILLLKFYKIF